MKNPVAGTNLLLLGVIGLGGWVVHDIVDKVMAEHAPPSAVSVAAPAAQAQPLSIALPPTSAQPVQVTLVMPTPTRSAQRSGQPASRPQVRIRSTAPPPTASRPNRGPTTRTSTTRINSTTRIDSRSQIVATDGSIVYVGADGQLIANTGSTSSSGVVSVGASGSSVSSGTSSAQAAPAGTEQARANGGTGRAHATVATGSAATDTSNASHANGSFAAVVPRSSNGQSTAISGFEDHSVSVIGNDQIVTYDDSNVFLGRDGLINANTGDTDSSGLNAVDVTGSVVRSGNSGDSESGDPGSEPPDPGDTEGGNSAGQAGQTSGTSSAQPSTTSSQQRSTAPARRAPATRGTAAPTRATVSDEGASTATGQNSLVVGADGYDDVSIRTRGDRDIVTYDDSNLVVGGTGPVNAQIGDSDTGGAVVMGIHDSDVRAGCEGDLCYSH